MFTLFALYLFNFIVTYYIIIGVAPVKKGLEATPGSQRKKFIIKRLTTIVSGRCA